MTVRPLQCNYSSLHGWQQCQLDVGHTTQGRPCQYLRAECEPSPLEAVLRRAVLCAAWYAAGVLAGALFL
jgi:hypothetical protein